MIGPVGRYAVLAAVAAATFFLPGTARAETLDSALQALTADHPRIEAAGDRLEAARQRARASLDEWYPDLGVDGHYGYERQNKPDADDTNTPTREIDLSLTQLLWDFGAANASITQARLELEQAAALLEAERQDVLVRGVAAYVDVQRRAKVLEFARGSVANIKRQTELENARVEEGAGLDTNVLQAKTQLAAAEARRVRAEGDYAQAINRYRAVFGTMPPPVADMSAPRLPVDLIPESEEAAVAVAMDENPSLAASELSSAIARAKVDATRAEEFFPVLQGVAESKWKQDVDGTMGFKGEQIAKVELSYDFDMGFTAVNTLRAARQDHSATARDLRNARRLAEERTRNAWSELMTSRQTAEHLGNQARIAASFLELAREERRLGKRSLIDVLAGETTLINARADAVSAQSDVVIAAYRLLAQMGRLQADALEP